MKQEKNKIEEIFNSLKYMPENITVDIEAEKRDFFENLEKKKRKKFIKKYYKYAAILIIGVLVTSIYYSQSNLKNTLQELSSKTFIPKGDTGKIILPDGSSVWLNSGSKLTYNDFSNSNIRKITLEGEGFFDVKKDKRPFVVYTTKNIEVKVLGTTFNVKAYPEDEKVETSLLTGKVQLSIKDTSSQKNIDMVPGEKVIYTKKTKEIHVKKDSNIESEKMWIGGKLIFKQETFKDIANELSRVFNVDIIINDKNLEKEIITASFTRSTSLREIFQVLKITSNFNYEFNNNKWILTR
ncbi:FecR family protein [Tenacibaculum sp. TC6]|uniref:FecR family protein n=1 Tax=Tenacibaculum sp. TC6 TaxID=3423223 RepID=UPI003D35EB8D